MEDFLTALQHAVKEEIVENYFHERRLLEEEAAEVEDLRQELEAAAGRLGRALNRLKLVLVEDRFFKGFWQRLGLDEAPRPGPDGPALEPEVVPSGWLWRGRYRRLVRRSAERVWRAGGEYRGRLKELRSLIEEVNASLFQSGFKCLASRSVNFNASNPRPRLQLDHFRTKRYVIFCSGQCQNLTYRFTTRGLVAHMGKSQPIPVVQLVYNALGQGDVPFEFYSDNPSATGTVTVSQWSDEFGDYGGGCTGTMFEQAKPN